MILFHGLQVMGVNDQKLIRKLYQWIKEQKMEEMSDEGIQPPRRKGSLTEGYGFWAEGAPFDENNYRDRIW